MLKKIILGLLVALILFAGYVALQPKETVIARSNVINAPVEEVFAYVDDFNNYNNWSPWAELDVDMKTTISEPSTGVGSTYEWSGNSEVGAGRLVSESTRPPNYIRQVLEFTEPFAATSIVEIKLAKEGANATQVEWTFYGTNDFVTKLFGVFVSVETMIGQDYETGLAKLKNILETP